MSTLKILGISIGRDQKFLLQVILDKTQITISLAGIYPIYLRVNINVLIYMLCALYL